ncbi:MAG: hypothetical protein JJT89_06305 [Nitriliruptoraceae bacterium]|nr:hypothetical protein [Nitriliruptoraceae bacterium]
MPVFGHALWFTEGRPPYDPAFAFEPLSIAALIAAIVGAVVWRIVARAVPRPELGFLRFLGRLGPWIPRLLAVHAGVSLLALAARLEFFVPTLLLPDTWWGIGLGILEGIVGVWLITGWKVRPAAWLLVIAGPLGMLGYGIIPILERADLLAIGVFLVLLPPDDERPGGRIVIDPERVRAALFGLRVLVGGTLILLAYTEKLARPELTLEFLDRYPAFNILQALGSVVGVEVSDLFFVQFAAGVEILFGLLLISGAMPQLTVIAAGIPFNATLFFLGATELIGHLPIYGAMLALLVYGSRDDTAPVCSWLPRIDGRMRTMPAR